MNILANVLIAFTTLINVIFPQPVFNKFVFINKAITSECTSPLEGSYLDEALKRVLFSLPDGWTLITGNPNKASRVYIEKMNEPGLSLQISAFNTNSTTYKCVKHQGEMIIERFEKAKFEVNKFTVYPEEILIDQKPATMGMINGFIYVPSRVPTQIVLLGISSNQTIFLFSFTTMAENAKDAEKVIEGMQEKFVSIVKTIQVD